jgi:pterin-4a-carbinolamine dehydratase
MPALITKQISDCRKDVPVWLIHAKTLHRAFKFKGFLDSIHFVKQVAAKAQKLNHIIPTSTSVSTKSR